MGTWNFPTTINRKQASTEELELLSFLVPGLLPIFVIYVVFHLSHSSGGAEVTAFFPGNPY